jgi:gliding motility-associated-like protein
MTQLHKHKSLALIICFLIQAALCFFSAAHFSNSIQSKVIPFVAAKIRMHNTALERQSRVHQKNTATTASLCNTINWATWGSFRGYSAVGTVNSAGTPIDVLMSANYPFDSTPQIYGYSTFSSYPIPIPNSTVPRTTWSAGPGGVTTMCFSSQVSNPVLLLSSLGSVNTSATLTFSLPYVVLYDGGGMQYNSNSSITGTEGYAIIMFPGNFTCVTIESDTPEFYTNITWGLMPPTFGINLSGSTTGCDQVTLTASGGQTYLWDGGDSPNSATNAFHTSGNYIVTVTRADGCTAYLADSVTVNPTVNAAVGITATNQVICAGTPVTFTAAPLNGGDSPVYQWQVDGINTGSNSSTFTSNSLAAGDIVKCVMTSNANCTVAASVTSNRLVMQVNPVPLVYAGGNKTIKRRGSTLLNATATGNIATISWSPGTGLDNVAILQPVASPLVTTMYTLTVTNTEGCIGKDSVTVTVATELIIPNTITPNGDGINDTWNIVNTGGYANITVDIFDRYGQGVFHSEGYHKPWDGTYNGRALPVGAYYYLINLNDGLSGPLSGWVAIIR